jgi:uncharacterized protein (TIGR03790 family)
LAALDAANVLIVENRNANISRQTAEFYMLRRKVPPANLCTIRVTATEEIERSDYVEHIERPIAGCVAGRPRGSAPIRSLLLTMGTPLRIKGTTGPAGTMASVDSELAVLPSRSLGRKIPVEGQVPNPYFGRAAGGFDERRYPIFLVCRLAAYDFGTVRKMVERALEARNRGRFVVDLHGPPLDHYGDGWLLDAVAKLPSARVKAEATAAVLEGERDVIGFASWGSNDKNRTKRLTTFQFLPGAVVTEFVSTDLRTLARPPAAWRIGVWENPATYFARSPQSMAPDYLEEGATAVTGHVAEPYLNYCPRPAMLFQPYYAGLTLAEAYYSSLPGLSWMNVLLGDPLCRLRP